MRLSLLPSLPALLFVLPTLLMNGPANAQAAVPLITTPSGLEPVRLASAVLDGEVHGRVLEATLDLAFLNPNARPLEGELQFPLREGQVLAGFALQMADGTMMPAVPVPKASARRAFDDTERVRVDPALLEQAEGNCFRLRIYPLSPGLARHVRLQLEVAVDVLARDGNALVLPLDFGGTPPQSLQVHLRLPAQAAHDLQPGPALAGAAIRSEGGRTWVDLVRQDLPAAPASAASLRWHAPQADAIATGRSDGQAWLHAVVRAPGGHSVRERPGRVVVVWDASGSGALRDHAREFRLLDALFRWQPSVRVVLRVVRDAAEPDRTFEVRSGDWHALRSVLAQLPYDGASNAGAWRVGPPEPGMSSLGLLFSDGRGNWGENAAPESVGVPAHAVLAAADADGGFLRHWAETRGGHLLDLSRLDDAGAFESLVARLPQLIRMEGDGYELPAIASRFPEAGEVQIAARFTGRRARIRLVWKMPDGSERRRHLSVEAPAAAAEGPVGYAARRWAGLRVAELEADGDVHQAEIADLGRQFGLVSRQTSLLVLENLADWLRFDLEPPAGPLRERFRAARHERHSGELAVGNAHLEQLAVRYAQYQSWWETAFPGDPPKADVTGAAGTPVVPMAVAPQAPGAPMTPAVRPRAAPVTATAGLMARYRLQPESAAAPPPMAGSTRAKAMRSGPAESGTPAMEADRPAIGLSLQVWAPDTGSAWRLRAATPGRRYEVYLDERAHAATSPAFFLDAAQLFEEQGDHALALRILSNLAELDSGDRALLRVLGYRLQQLGEREEALRVLRRVTLLAPDEPQSWRDLGLAEAAAGKWQAGVDALWRVASGVWSARFADIDLIALTELDAIAANHPGVDVSAVDARLRRNLPLDLRVALAWDADNTDVDLWVKDPDGEWTSYQSPLSRQGGHVSRDCTQGYGPEVFSLRHAKPGRYEVRARYYGSTRQTVGGYPTLMMHLAHDFGTAREDGRDVVVRLEQVKDDLLIGSFDVGTTGQGGKP